MPKIKQYADEYARRDFQTEIRIRQGQYDLMSINALARATGIPATTLGPKLKDPDKMDVVDLRKIVKTVHPDPVAVLTLLGYTGKEIRKALQPEETPA